jgi:uncharacterized protein YbaA (DUF1428 family)
MSFVDGYVLACPEDKKADYVEMASKVAGKFKELGALQVMECWSADVPHGKVTDFYRATQAKDGEAIVFSWVVWPDKDTRNAGWAALMEDESLRDNKPPFDGQRMFWGGFEVIVQA